jgi:hypothetical protein
MPSLSVAAVYDGTTIKLLEDAPVQGPYKVVVTFVEPADDPTATLDRFWDSFGAWQDDEPLEATLARLREDRRSKGEPPAL